MADGGNTCVGCSGSLDHKDFMSCKECKQNYDLQCASLSPKRFRSFNEEKMRKWLCPECICKRPKGDNSDTPVRSTHLQRPVSPSGVVHEKPSIGNVTRRKKSPASGSFITEERVREMWRDDMKQDLKSVVDSSVRELSGQLKVINSQCTEFHASLSYVCKQYDDLHKELSDFKQLFGNAAAEIKWLKEENKSLKQSMSANITRLQLLEEENLKQQQWARIQNVEITGIPEQKDETTTDLVLKVTEHIGVTIQPTDIEFAHRVQPRRTVSASRARPIVVRLRQRIFKDQMIAAARKHRDMTTKHIGIGGDTNKIFVNEHLTKDNKMLLGACKLRAKEVGYMYIWTKNCRIFVRRNETSPPVLINSSADLAKIV